MRQEENLTPTFRLFGGPGQNLNYVYSGGHLHPGDVKRS
jgi:hypothetical protein